MIKKIAFVAHPTRDLAAARKFFGEALGLQLQKEYSQGDGDGWVEYGTPDGKTIALDTFSPKNSPDASVYMALETDDIAAEVKNLEEHGVRVAMQPWSNESKDGELMCKMAIVLDPDGNAIMLHEIAPDRAED